MGEEATLSGDGETGGLTQGARQVHLGGVAAAQGVPVDHTLALGFPRHRQDQARTENQSGQRFHPTGKGVFRYHRVASMFIGVARSSRKQIQVHDDVSPTTAPFSMMANRGAAATVGNARDPDGEGLRTGTRSASLPANGGAASRVAEFKPLEPEIDALRPL
jgi:hypothetical protein